MRENVYAAATRGASATSSQSGQRYEHGGSHDNQSAGSSSSSSSDHQGPIAAALTSGSGGGNEEPSSSFGNMREHEFSSMMKRKLSDFVKKIMQAEIHEGEIRGIYLYIYI